MTAPLRLIRPDTMAGAAQRLRHALEGGVATRVTAASTPTCDLSGGLDSTSLCFLVCEHLLSTRAVTAVTVHPDGQPDGGGDLGYAQAAVRHAGGRIVPRLLPLASQHLPYSGLDKVRATDEPAPSTITYSRLAAEFALLAELGSDCHFTGDGGDSLLHPHGYLTDLARSGRWLRLAGHALGWARLQRCSPWTLLAASLSRARAVAAADWLTPQAIELATPDDGGSGLARWDANTRTLREVQTVGRTVRADAQLAEAFGLTIHNPYTDSSVIAAALSVPPWWRGDPWRYKPLLTMALGDLLPPAIASRTTKGGFDADHYRGLRANLPAVLDLADGRLAELGLVDVRRLQATLQRAAAGLPIPFGFIEPAIAIEVWLQRVARCIPAKVACFEESTSAAVTLALSGRHAGWRHGIASDPVRMHAWIEVAGQPVGESPSTSRYTLLIRLP